MKQQRWTTLFLLFPLWLLLYVLLLLYGFRQRPPNRKKKKTKECCLNCCYCWRGTWSWCWWCWAASASCLPVDQRSYQRLQHQTSGKLTAHTHTHKPSHYSAVCANRRLSRFDVNNTLSLSRTHYQTLPFRVFFVPLLLALLLSLSLARYSSVQH